MMKRVLAGAACLALAGCSSGGSSGGSSTSEETKTLSIGGTFASLSLMSTKPLYGIDSFPMAVSTYKVRCVTLSGPLAAGEGTVASSAPYSFSLSMTAGLNAPIGCFLLGDDAIVATLAFGSESSMSGGTKAKTAYSPRPDSTSLTLGTINVSGGVATPAGAITENGTAAKPTFAAMSGTWVLSSIYENTAENYIHPCDMDYDATEQATLNAACRSNWSTKGMYVHHIQATNGTDTRNGLGLWDSETASTACSAKEGVTLDTGWSTVGSNWTAGAFSYATVDMSNIDATVLSKARFKKSTYNGVTNCPHDSMGNDLPGCDTANDCGDFTYTADEDGSREKVRCVANSLSSGGDFGYNWGSSSCGGRAEVNWTTLHNGTATFDSDGTGCSDNDCANSIDTAGSERPQNRMFFSELFIDGNVGTSAESDTWNCFGATMQDTTAITVTQSSATTATFVVESSMSFAGGTDSQKAACLAGDSHVASSYGKVRRMKMVMAKQ